MYRTPGFEKEDRNISAASINTMALDSEMEMALANLSTIGPVRRAASLPEASNHDLTRLETPRYVNPNTRTFESMLDSKRRSIGLLNNALEDQSVVQKSVTRNKFLLFLVLELCLS